ncbi:TPA: hypothetical protein TY768_000938 [Streptococcus suis]|nr:hypothetical protein [Streptococcus suis]
MLQVSKTRHVSAEFFVNEGEQRTLVKQTVVNISNDAVSTVSENLFNPDLYAKNRREMRTDEAKLRELIYKIEDEILSEQAESADESSV